MNDEFKKYNITYTGLTKSFRNAILKHFIDLEPKEIRIFSRDEKKQDDIQKVYFNIRSSFI